MTELDKMDVFLVNRRLPSNVIKSLKAMNGVYLAGGFIRSVIAHEEPSDIDLFVPNITVANMLAVNLVRYRPRHQEVTEIRTNNAITLYGGKLPIQIITRWTYETPQDLVASFDFTVCQATLWYETINTVGRWHSLCSGRFYTDLASKRLVYTAPKRIEEAGGSLLRVLKYQRRGYTIPLNDLGKVVARLHLGVDQEAFKRHLDHMTEEEALGFVYSGLLREVDPLLDPDSIFTGDAHDHQTETD